MQIINVIKDSSTECAPFDWGMSLFSYGCNLHCKMCEGYNYETVTNKDNITGNAINLIKSNITPLHDCIIFIGGEPTIWGNKLKDALQYCHEIGLKTKIFTNGMLPEEVKEINKLNLCDAWSVDFKGVNNIKEQFGIDDETYFSKWYETIDNIKKYQLPLEIRTTFFEGNEEDREEIINKCNDIINLYQLDNDKPVYHKYIIQEDVRSLI